MAPSKFKSEKGKKRNEIFLKLVLKFYPNLCSISYIEISTPISMPGDVKTNKVVGLTHCITVLNSDSISISNMGRRTQEKVNS